MKSAILCCWVAVAACGVSFGSGDEKSAIAEEINSLGNEDAYSSHILRQLYLPRALRYLYFGSTLEDFELIEQDLSYLGREEGINLKEWHKCAVISINKQGVLDVMAMFDEAYPHYFRSLAVRFDSKQRRDHALEALMGEPQIEGFYFASQRDGGSIIATKSEDDSIIYKISLPKEKDDESARNIKNAELNPELSTRERLKAVNGTAKTSIVSPKKFHSYSVSQVGVKLHSNNGRYAEGSWKCVLNNTTKSEKAYDVKLRFLDAQGYELDYDSIYAVKVPAYGQVNLSDQFMVKSNLWSQYKKKEVVVVVR